MLPANLTTNEVKDSSGTEVEFLRMSVSERKVIFAKNGEAPNAPYRLTVSHSETGSGVDLRRRSLIRVDKTVTGSDNLPRTISFYAVGDLPTGDLATAAEMKNVLANLISFLASTGGDTTVKFDCTGNGADAMINGTI